MKVMLTSVALMAGFAATIAAHAEIIIVPFNNSTPTATTGSYSGEVTVSVSGVGQSDGAALNDAFYVYTDQSGAPATPQDMGYYDLGFGTGGSASSIDNFVSPIPAYSATHAYTFNIDTGLSTPAPLEFSLVDDNYADNSGSFTISVSEAAAVTEPAAWALMLVGIGGLGATMRSRRRLSAIVA